MNLVEAPDHAGPAAPPHAPRSSSGRSSRRDATRRMMRRPRVKREGSHFFSPLKLILGSYSDESKDSNIFAPGVEALEGRKFLPSGFTTLP